MQETKFIERRKEYRLPYGDKIIFTDGHKAAAAYAANISRGGVFVSTLDPYPIDTTGFLAFLLPNQPQCLCVKAKVVHIVFDRQRCEIDCGMGFQFMDITESQRSILNLHILNEQATYQELKRLLGKPRPDPAELDRCLRRMPSLGKLDLLGLRYKVNRICTIFEPAPDPFSEDKSSAA
jgi:Tfp pilus assembly protein PilZ